MRKVRRNPAIASNKNKRVVMTPSDIKKGIDALDSKMKVMEYTLDNLKVFADYDVTVASIPGNKIRFTKGQNSDDFDIPQGNHRGIPPILLDNVLTRYIKEESQEDIMQDILQYKKLQKQRRLLKLQKDFVQKKG